ncbi:G domain-containing protein [Entamoeba marina]
MSKPADAVEIIFVGLPKTGKTTLIKQLTDKEVDTDYCMTSHEEATEVIWEIGKTNYKIRFNDAPGNQLTDARTTANTFLQKSNIHVLCCAKNSLDTVEFLEGLFKDVSGYQPKYRLVFMTFDDEEEDSDAISACKEFLSDSKLYQVNAVADKQRIKDYMNEFFKKAIAENPDLFKNFKATGKPDKQTSDKPKKDKEKGGCCSIF